MVKSLKVIFILVALVFLISACSTTPTTPSQSTPSQPTPSQPAVIAETGNSSWPMQGFDTRRSGLSPNIAPKTSRLLWQVSEEGGLSSIAIGKNGNIITGSYHGDVLAFSKAGKKLWEFKTGNLISATPAIGEDGTIYVASKDGVLYALDEGGDRKWKFQTGARIVSSPAVSKDGTIYVGSYDKHAYAINSDGTLKWKYRTGAAINASPAIAPDGTVYFPSNDGNIYAFDSDGNKKWDFTGTLGFITDPAVLTNGDIIAASSDSILFSVTSDGKKNWERQFHKSISGSISVGYDDTIFIGCNDGYLYVIDHTSGKTLRKYNLQAPIIAAPIIDKHGSVYVGTIAGVYYALDLKGQPIWTMRVGREVLYQSALSEDGTLYITTMGPMFAIKD